MNKADVIPLSPMQVIRQGRLLTDIPDINDLTFHNGTLYVLLWKVPNSSGGWDVGWYTVAAPFEVIEYLFS